MMGFRCGSSTQVNKITGKSSPGDSNEQPRLRNSSVWVLAQKEKHKAFRSPRRPACLVPREEGGLVRGQVKALAGKRASWSHRVWCALLSGVPGRG